MAKSGTKLGSVDLSMDVSPSGGIQWLIVVFSCVYLT